MSCPLQTGPCSPGICVCRRITFFLHIGKLLSAGRGFFLVLWAAGHAEALRVHYGASLGPGLAPLRVLWVFKVVRAGSFSRDRIPPSRAY